MRWCLWFLPVLLLGAGCGDKEPTSAPREPAVEAPRDPRPTETHNVRANLKTGWWAEQGSNGVTSWDCSLPTFSGRVASSALAERGQVLAADNSANVYVISLGAEDGIKTGDRFDVVRDGVRIGAVKITDVQAKQAAGIRSGGGTTPIGRGDTLVPAAR